MLECVINLSEGRDTSVIAAISAAASDHVLDVHNDPDHHRAVLTLCGRDPEGGRARAVALRTVELVDLRNHRGYTPETRRSRRRTLRPTRSRGCRAPDR